MLETGWGRGGELTQVASSDSCHGCFQIEYTIPLEVIVFADSAE